MRSKRKGSEELKASFCMSEKYIANAVKILQSYNIYYEIDGSIKDLCGEVFINVNKIDKDYVIDLFKKHGIGFEIKIILEGNMNRKRANDIQYWVERVDHFNWYAEIYISQNGEVIYDKLLDEGDFRNYKKVLEDWANMEGNDFVKKWTTFERSAEEHDEYKYEIYVGYLADIFTNDGGIITIAEYEDKDIEVNISFDEGAYVKEMYDYLKNKSSDDVYDFLNELAVYTEGLQASKNKGIYDKFGDKKIEIILEEKMNRKRANYRGWENYETWAVVLWIENDEELQNYFYELSKELTKDELAQEIVNYLQDENPVLLGPSCFSDFMQNAIGNVNTHEIAEFIKECVEE